MCAMIRCVMIYLAIFALCLLGILLTSIDLAKNNPLPYGCEDEFGDDDD